MDKNGLPWSTTERNTIRNCVSNKTGEASRSFHTYRNARTHRPSKGAGTAGMYEPIYNLKGARTFSEDDLSLLRVNSYEQLAPNQRIPCVCCETPMYTGTYGERVIKCL